MTDARDTADVTDRQNVQLHWIRIEDVPEIWRRLEAVGLDTLEACGDCTRTTLGSPVAGVHPDEVIDATPAIRSLLRRVVRAAGQTTLVVTHDVLDAVVLAHRLVVLAEGGVVESGPTAEVLTRPRSPFPASAVASSAPQTAVSSTAVK